MLNIPGIKGAQQSANSSPLSDVAGEAGTSEDGTFLQTLEAIHQQVPQHVSDSDPVPSAPALADGEPAAAQMQSAGDTVLETVPVNLNLAAANEPDARPSALPIDDIAPAVQGVTEGLAAGQGMPATHTAPPTDNLQRAVPIANGAQSTVTAIDTTQQAEAVDPESPQQSATNQPLQAQTVSASAQTTTAEPRPEVEPARLNADLQATAQQSDANVAAASVDERAQSQGLVSPSGAVTGQPEILAQGRDPADGEPAFVQAGQVLSRTGSTDQNSAVAARTNPDAQVQTAQSDWQAHESDRVADERHTQILPNSATTAVNDSIDRAQNVAPAAARSALAAELSAADPQRSSGAAPAVARGTDDADLPAQPAAPVIKNTAERAEEPAPVVKPAIAESRVAIAQQAEQQAVARAPVPLAPTDSSTTPLIADRPALTDSVGGLLSTTLAGSLSTSAPSAEVAGAHRLVNASVRANINWMIEQGMARATLQLNPAELGALNIKLETLGDQLNVSIHAAQSATRDVLEQTLPRLREHLSQQGFTEVNVSLGNNQQQSAEYSQARGDGEPSQTTSEALTGVDDGAPVTDGANAAKSSHRGMVDVFA